MRGTKMPSQREEAIWASGLNKELVIDMGLHTSLPCWMMANQTPAALDPQLSWVVSLEAFRQEFLTCCETRHCYSYCKPGASALTFSKELCAITVQTDVAVSLSPQPEDGVFPKLWIPKRPTWQQGGPKLTNIIPVSCKARGQKGTLGMAANLWVPQVEQLRSFASHCLRKTTESSNSPGSPIKKTGKMLGNTPSCVFAILPKRKQIIDLVQWLVTPWLEIPGPTQSLLLLVESSKISVSLQQLHFSVKSEKVLHGGQFKTEKQS